MKKYKTNELKSLNEIFLACRTESTLEDVAVAFERHKINLGELEEFVNNVDIPKFSGTIVQFPHPTETKLGFVDDPSNEEIRERINNEDKEHIYEYFPLMKRIDKPESVIQKRSTTECIDLINETERQLTEEQEATVTKNGVQ